MRSMLSWFRALRHSPEMTRIRAVDVGANDILFVLIDPHVSAERAAAMKEQLRHIGLSRTVIMGGGITDIGVIRESDALAGS